MAMSCRELVTLITDYLDGALPAHDRARFEAHLADCEGCQHYMQQFRVTLRLVGQLTEDNIAADARDELLNVFRSWKQTPASS